MDGEKNVIEYGSVNIEKKMFLVTTQKVGFIKLVYSEVCITQGSIVFSKCYKIN